MAYTKKDLTAFIKAQEAYDAESAKLVERVHTIIKTIHKAFGFKGKDWTWWFPEAAEGTVGGIHHTGSLEKLDGEVCYDTYHVNQDFSTDEWDYTNDFPSTFLVQTEKQILERIQEEIQRTKLNKNETHEYDLRKRALNKLSNAEKKALGVIK